MKQLLSDEKGQGVVEYGLIIMLVALLLIGVISLIGTNVTAFFSSGSELFK